MRNCFLISICLTTFCNPLIVFINPGDEHIDLYSPQGFTENSIANFICWAWRLEFSIPWRLEEEFIFGSKRDYSIPFSGVAFLLSSGCVGLGRVFVGNVNNNSYQANRDNKEVYASYSAYTAKAWERYDNENSDYDSLMIDSDLE